MVAWTATSCGGVGDAHHCPKDFPWLLSGAAGGPGPGALEPSGHAAPACSQQSLLTQAIPAVRDQLALIEQISTLVRHETRYALVSYGPNQRSGGMPGPKMTRYEWDE